MKTKLGNALRQARAKQAPNGLGNKWQGASLLGAIFPAQSEGNLAQNGTAKPEDVMQSAYAKMKFYRLPEVLEILQVSRAKFLKMVKDGDAPPPIKCGGCALYVADEIDRFAIAMILKSRTERPFDISELLARMGMTF